jgi:3D (Asp-Asp-Asp) domain-containing protein
MILLKIKRPYLILIFSALLFFSGCANMQTRNIETTAYCGCSECCGWTRGKGKYLKLNFWNRYYVKGGGKYQGLTASGKEPRQYNPGLISIDSLKHPWMIPPRLLLPWLIFSHPGTIAADTVHYPFGTIMDIPGYGRGIVQDRGSAIKGPNRIDLFFNSHQTALKWGRKTIPVKIKKK